MDSWVRIDYNINSIDFYELAWWAGRKYFAMTDVCLDDTPHMQFVLRSEGSWQAQQIFCSNARHGSSTHISNGWLVWRGFLQVLEIMSRVVIFECCLQGLRASPFTARRQGMHQSGGTLPLIVQVHHLVTLWSRYAHLHGVRLIDKLPAWWADIQRVRHFFHWLSNALDYCSHRLSRGLIASPLTWQCNAVWI